MASEIRVNSLSSRTGLSTVTFTDTGPIFSGITTFQDNSGFNVGTGGSIFSPASNTVTLGTNSAERLRIASNGDIGIGTVTPLALYRSLSIHGPANDQGGVLDLATKDLSSRGYVFNDSNGLFVQTATNHSIVLRTNNAERLRITSGGDIGIGTDDPGNHKLHLYGETNSDLRLTATGNDIVNIFVDSNRSSADTPIFAIKGEWNGTQIANMKFVAGSDTTNKDDGYISFNTRESGTGASSERLRIKSDGDVYIGNIAHSNDGGVNSSYRTLTLTDITNGAQLHLRGQSPKLFLDVTSGGNGEIYYDSGDLRILSGEPGGTSSEKLRITSSGSIGIGTVNPGSKLTVYETGGNAKLQLQRANTANNTDDYGSILWRSMGGTAVGAINVARATAENDGYMFFQTTSGGTMSEMMRIQPSGYVGIGENAPGGRLTVKHANTSTSGLNATLKLKQGVATNGNRSSLIFSSLDDFDVAAVNGVVDTHSGTAANNVGHLEFWTKESGNATAQERMRVHPTGQVSINSAGWMGRFHIQQDAITEPALSIRHHDASLYKHMGTVGPTDRNGSDASGGGTYLHVRVRTIWNDSSMTMFRITGYYPYSDYTHSFVGMYRYGNSGYRTNPYGQTIHNLKRATIHSIYNEAASPGYLVFVCDWPTNYTGLMFEHIGAGTQYGAYMQNDIEIIDSLRSSGTSGLTF